MPPRQELIQKSPKSLFNAEKWGVSPETVKELPIIFSGFLEDFADCFRTKTWNNAQYAEAYALGLFCLERGRTYAQISRTVNDVRDDGQNVQHFMSDSPWEAGKLFAGIQKEIRKNPRLAGGALVIDGSADARKGKAAGVARQYGGRMGKVDSCQAGVALVYCKDGLRAIVDAELYLPEEWFDEAHRTMWRSLHIPPDREFETKLDIALTMVKRAKDNGLPFSVVCCDDEYGCSRSVRKILNEEGIVYVADVPSKTLFWRTKPEFKVPDNPPDKRGRRYSLPRPVAETEPLRIDAIARGGGLTFYPIRVRDAERGILTYEMAFLRGWTVKKQHVMEETLMIWKEADGRFTYSLCNAPANTSYTTLAQWKSQRFFVERAFQDAKSDLGWDELMAVKYRSWMHHVALVALALWFVMTLLLFWLGGNRRDFYLCRQLRVRILPQLSAANIGILFRVALRLSPFTIEEGIFMVMKFLIARARSTACRLRRRGGENIRGEDLW